MIAALVSLVLGVAAGGVPSPAERPDVLILLLDDLSDADLDELQTPRLDELAGSGVRFRRAYAHPVCSPSRYALLYGNYAFRAGIGGALPADDGPLELKGPSLAQLFSREGYRTGLVGKWHLSRASAPREVAQAVHAAGFRDWRAGIPYGVDSYFRWRLYDSSASGAFEVRNGRRYITTEQSESFAGWWKKTPAPRFCTLAFQALHGPFEKAVDQFPTSRSVSSPLKGREALLDKRWRMMGHDLDSAIGRVLDAVDLERTLVLCVADNGSYPMVGTYPRNRSKPRIYEGGARVPLIVAGAGITAGPQSDALVGIVDVAATLAELLELELPDTFRDSKSFAPALRGEAFAGREFVYTQRFSPDGFGERKGQSEAVVSRGGLKLLRFDARREEAYDVLADPQEQKPLEPTEARFAPLRAVLDAYGD